MQEPGAWDSYFASLIAQGRAFRATARGIVFWVSVEKLAHFSALYPDAGDAVPEAVTPQAIAPDDALLAMVTGWTMHCAPVTATSLGANLGLLPSEIEKALLRMEAAGSILRGQFEGWGVPAANSAASSPPALDAGGEWCDRRLLARIHRLTLGKLRKQIEPITAAQFMNWLLAWQHVAPGTQLKGERGVLEILRQIQGFEIPANAWEQYVLASRVSNYQPEILDQLCLTGAAGWGRLSPHPATVQPPANDDFGKASHRPTTHAATRNGHPAGRRGIAENGISANQMPAPQTSAGAPRFEVHAKMSPAGNKSLFAMRPLMRQGGSPDFPIPHQPEPDRPEPIDPEPHPPSPVAARTPRRIVPTSVAPITFYVRDQADWMSLDAGNMAGRLGGVLQILSPGARAVHDFLLANGASFFADIVRSTGKLKAEIETALWELVAAGVATADGFDNLRTLIDPAARGKGSKRGSRPRHTAGRWTLLKIPRAPALSAGEAPAGEKGNSGAAPAPGRAGSEDQRYRAVEAVCRMLLRRYGVVFRELLVRESILPKWRELQVGFRRLEARGEVRGGRFISGFLGEQFALPEAVDSLRLARRASPTADCITISAADPLNLVGIVVPGERVPAISGRWVTFRAGVAVLPAGDAESAGEHGAENPPMVVNDLQVSALPGFSLDTIAPRLPLLSPNN